MSPPPIWASLLVEKVCRSVQIFEEDSPIGCHYYCGEESHEISIFVSPTEIVGGPNDGHRIQARFVVDIVELMKHFDVLDAVTWQSQVVDETDDLGPHLSVTGEYLGEQVWVRILGNTPEQFLPGRIADFEERRFVNIWDEQD
ncbi:hypothetical protein [Thalassoglobus sp.]|uniref:hypothetical protein n=1 Tax=Thalassoglobus sp. TaxID=2795869 RepID=UPI003AA7ABAF